MNHWFKSRDWPSHLHSQIELMYVRRGALEVSIDSQTRVLQAGDFAVAFPNCIHSYRHVPGVEDVDVVFYIVNPYMTGDFADKICAYVPQMPYVLKPDVPRDARTAMLMLAYQKNAYQATVTKSYIQIALACVWPFLQITPGKNRSENLPYRVLRYVTQHFEEPLTLEMVAADLQVSKNHVSRVFTQKLHMHFSEYLSFLRIETAKDLLRHTDQSIIDILYQCGYDSPRTFNRVFKSACGTSPREYRRQKQRG